MPGWGPIINRPGSSSFAVVTGLPCTRLKTDQFGEVQDVIDLTAEFAAVGEDVVIGGQSSGETGTFVKFVYTLDSVSPTQEVQQFVVVKEASGSFTPGESLDWWPISDISDITDTGIDLNSDPDQTSVNCDTSQDPTDPDDDDYIDATEIIIVDPVE